MSQSQMNTKDDEVAKAQALANKITLNRFNARLTKDPSSDLSELLKQQASTYPQLRAQFAQSAQQRATKPADTVNTDNGKQTRNLILPDFDVIHPLDENWLGTVRDELGGYSGARSTEGDCRELLNEAIERGEVLWDLHGKCVLAISGSAVVIISGPVDLDATGNLHYVNTHTPELQVPTPRLLGALRSNRRVFIFMTKAAGVTLESLWPQLSSTQKASIQSQLSAIFSVLRAEPSNPDAHTGPQMGGFESGICKDTRRFQRVSDRPICSEGEFNDFLCSDPRRTATPWIKMLRSFLKEDHRLVRTHGDLHPRNIMVEWVEGEEGGPAEQTDKRIRITSLIDWDLGGWYPEYWEFVKALATLDLRSPLADWCDYLPVEAIGSWPVEFSLDCLIGRWFG